MTGVPVCSEKSTVTKSRCVTQAYYSDVKIVNTETVNYKSGSLRNRKWEECRIVTFHRHSTCGLSFFYSYGSKYRNKIKNLVCNMIKNLVILTFHVLNSHVLMDTEHFQLYGKFYQHYFTVSSINLVGDNHINDTQNQCTSHYWYFFCLHKNIFTKWFLHTHKYVHTTVGHRIEKLTSTALY